MEVLMLELFTIISDQLSASPRALMLTDILMKHQNQLYKI